MVHANPQKLASTTRPVLPPELEDLVIDYLHDEFLALSACAVVCSNWLPRARQHLFERLTLSCGRLRGFLDVLTVSPAIGAYVKCIAIHCVQPPDSPYLCSECIQLGIGPGLELCDLLRRMDNIRQLQMQQLQLASTSLPVLGSLEELRFTKCRVFCVGSSIDGFLDCIFKLPSIRSLSMTDMALAGPSWTPDTPTFSTTTSLLSDVDLWSPQNHIFCAALAKRLVNSGLAIQIRRLSLILSEHDRSPVLLESLSAFMRSLGPALNYLELMVLPRLSTLRDNDMPYASLIRQLWGCLTLSQCPNLRHLRLLGCFGDAYSPSLLGHHIEWAVDLLSSLTCAGIEDVTFVLDPHTPSMDVAGEWMDRMFEVLAARASVFARLERVVFELCTAVTACTHTTGSQGTQEAAERIARRWGPWRRKGITYEVAESDRPPLDRGQRGEDGSVVNGARTILVSTDGEQPFQLIDQ